MQILTFKRGKSYPVIPLIAGAVLTLRMGKKVAAMPAVTEGWDGFVLGFWNEVGLCWSAGTLSHLDQKGSCIQISLSLKIIFTNKKGQLAEVNILIGQLNYFVKKNLFHFIHELL